MLASDGKLKSTGFTIVELLIVIVVIGILAAISIVAYNGIQARAHNTTVKNDISNIAKKIHLIKAETGDFPEGTYFRESASVGSGSYHGFPDVDYRPAVDSYYLPVSGGYANFVYCEGPRAGTGEQVFQLHFSSSADKRFMYASDLGVREVSSHPGSTASRSCVDIDYPSSISYGYVNSWFAPSLR